MGISSTNHTTAVEALNKHYPVFLNTGAGPKLGIAIPGGFIAIYVAPTAGLQ